MARNACKLLGLVLLLVGILGFTNLLHSLGAHVGPNDASHNLIHIVSGVLALYLGFAGSPSGARTFCLIFGVVYLALGAYGLVKGDLNIHRLKLVLGHVDHLIHVVVGVAFLAGGLLTKNG